MFENLGEIEKLIENFLHVKRINLNEIIPNSIKSLISPSLIIFWFSMVPFVIPFAVHYLKHKDKAMKEIAVSVRYFDILLVLTLSLYLSLTIPASIQAAFSKLKSEDIFESLGVQLSSSSTLFIKYVILSGIGMLPVNLFRAGELLHLWLFVCKTKKDDHDDVKKDTHDDENGDDNCVVMEFPYSYWYGYTLLMLAITIAYSILAPLILLFSLCYFGIAYVTFLYQFVTVYKPTYSIGRKIWANMFSRVTFGLYITVVWFDFFSLY